MLSEKHIKRKPYIDHAGKYQDVLWTTGIRICFVFHLFLQMGLEFTFLFLSYKLQQGQNRSIGIANYKVPEMYICVPSEHTDPNGFWSDPRADACQQSIVSNRVICYSSRAWEKSIFLVYMTGCSLVSIFITFLEFFHFIIRCSYKGVRNRTSGRQSTSQLNRKSRGYNPYQKDSFQKRKQKYTGSIQTTEDEENKEEDGDFQAEAAPVRKRENPKKGKTFQ